MAGPLCTGLVEVWVQFQASKREDSKTGGSLGCRKMGRQERVNYVMRRKGLLKPWLVHKRVKVSKQGETPFPDGNPSLEGPCYHPAASQW